MIPRAAVDLEPLRDRLAGLGRAPTPADVATAMRAEGRMVSDAALIETVEALRRHSVGAGPLEDLLRTPGVTDILVNGPDQVYVDRGAGLELTGLRFAHDGEVRQLAQRLADDSHEGALTGLEVQVQHRDLGRE